MRLNNFFLEDKFVAKLNVYRNLNIYDIKICSDDIIAASLTIIIPLCFILDIYFCSK